MEKRKLWRFILPALSMAVMAAYPAAAFAGETQLDGKTGSTERIASNVREAKPAAIQQVALPANAENVFDFILDPCRLINRTDAAAYDGKKFEKDATLFFKRSDGGVEEDYSSSSDKIRIVNEGEKAVDVVLTARISALDGIRMTDDRRFKDDIRPSLYLALTDGDHIVPIDEVDGAVIRTTIPGSSHDENTCSFWLTGAANRNGNWTAMETVSPRVTVTWQIGADEEAAWKDMAVQDAEMREGDFDKKVNMPDDRDTTDGPWDVSDTEPRFIFRTKE